MGDEEPNQSRYDSETLSRPQPTRGYTLTLLLSCPDIGDHFSHGGSPRLAQDEPMAIGDEATGAVCDEPGLVQNPWPSVPE